MIQKKECERLEQIFGRKESASQRECVERLILGKQTVRESERQRAAESNTAWAEYIDGSKVAGERLSLETGGMLPVSKAGDLVQPFGR